jgi:hypothetical protein
MKLTNPFASALVELAAPDYSTKAWKRFNYTDPTSVTMGIRVPQVRSLLKEHSGQLTIEWIKELIVDNRHEFRLCAVLGLVQCFEDCDSSSSQRSVVEFYLEHLEYVNNWDLVDASCHKILGVWLVKEYMADMKQFSNNCIAINMDDGLDDTIHFLEEALEKLPDWYTDLVLSNDLWKIRISIVMLLLVQKFCVSHYIVPHFNPL